ncbi:MAG TPA: ATP synthase subunit I [Blastocatellia bacterium]|nr:ATP synthase subunit I [Blastocatellia bacterium]
MRFLRAAALAKPATALIKFAALTMDEKGDRETAAPESATPVQSTEPLAFASPDRVERRVWRNILVVIVLATAVAAVFGDLKFTLGVALGGALALLNYKWLHSSLRAILSVGSEKTPPGTRIKIVVRWLVIAGVAWAANQTGYFDAVGIIAGLMAPALAVMMEAAYVTYKTVVQRNGER